MKKILLALFVLSSVSVFAQSDDDEKLFHVGIGTALSLPIGDLKESSSFGVGFQVQPSYLIAENIEGFVQVGVDVFKSKGGFGDEDNLLHVPLLAGARFKTLGFFAGGGVGYGLWTGGGESLKGFMFSPQVGYDAGKLEVGLNYSSTSVTGSKLSYIGLKLFRKF